MQKKNIKLEEIIKLYDTYNNVGIVAEKLNCCIANVCRRLKKAGVVISRDYTRRRESTREKIYVDESYFKEINTESKAYFLGLMYADGSLILNINRNHNCLNFTSGSLEFLKQLQEKLKVVSITNGGISKERLKRKYNKYLLSN